MRVFAAIAVVLLVTACQTAPPPEMTEAEKTELVSSATQAAAGAIAAFDAEDASYFSYYSDWADYPATSYPPLSEMPDRLQTSWWDRYEDRSSVMGEVKGLVLGPNSVVLERIDTSTVTDSDGTRLAQSWVGRQLWFRENGEWKILFEGFQMLSSEAIQ